jgi:ribosomal-protein-alanine N-acetyltransferase
MRLQDIAQVVEIERESFPSPWSAANFRQDLLFNRAAHYLVVCGELPQGEKAPKRGLWLDRAISWARHLGGKGEGGGDDWVVGYIGLWLTTTEAHLTTIAVRERLRRQGLGELLLLKAIELAVNKGAQSVSLEVRPANTAARALYRKYGFAEVGVRRGYYYDTGEDALLMAAEGLSSASFQSKLHRLKQAIAARWRDTPPESLVL